MPHPAEVAGLLVPAPPPAGVLLAAWVSLSLPPPLCAFPRVRSLPFWGQASLLPSYQTPGQHTSWPLRPRVFRERGPRGLAAGSTGSLSPWTSQAGLTEVCDAGTEARPLHYCQLPPAPLPRTPQLPRRLLGSVWLPPSTLHTPPLRLLCTSSCSCHPHPTVLPASCRKPISVPRGCCLKHLR